MTKSLEMECTAGNDLNNFLVECVSTRRGGGGEIISEAVLGTSSSAGSKHTDRLSFKGLVNILLFCKLQFWAPTTNTLPIIPGPSCRSSGCFSLRWWRNIPIPVRKSFGWPTSIQKPEKVHLYTVLLYSKHLQYSGIPIFKPTAIQVMYIITRETEIQRIEGKISISTCSFFLPRSSKVVNCKVLIVNFHFKIIGIEVL